MKRNLLVILLLISEILIAQVYNFGKLNYQLTPSAKIENFEGMRKIVFDDTDENIVILIKIPNQSLPNLYNSQYNLETNKENILSTINEMAQKTLIAKDNDLITTTLLSHPKFINTGKINLVAYIILNKLKSNGTEIREFYLVIPNINESYLIINTSYKHNADFANLFQKMLDSLSLEK